MATAAFDDSAEKSTFPAAFVIDEKSISPALFIILRRVSCDFLSKSSKFILDSALLMASDAFVADPLSPEKSVLSSDFCMSLRFFLAPSANRSKFLLVFVIALSAPVKFNFPAALLISSNPLALLLNFSFCSNFSSISIVLFMPCSNLALSNVIRTILLSTLLLMMTSPPSTFLWTSCRMLNVVQD